MGQIISNEMATIYTTIAALQVQAEAVAVIDMRGPSGVNPEHMVARGVDVSKLLVSQPDTLTQAVEIIESLARSGVCAAIYVLCGISSVETYELRMLARASQTALFFV